MPDTNFADQGQFQFIYDALVQKYPGIAADGITTTFQFAETPIQANWKKGSDITAYNLANSVPLSLGGYYTPSPSPLFNAYQDLILSIKPANYDDNVTYETYQKQLGDLIGQRDAQYTQITTAWTSYVQQNTQKDGTLPETKEQWEKDPMGGAKYNDDLQDVLTEISTLQGRIANLTKSMDAALSAAQNDLANDAYKNNYIQEDGSSIRLPKIDIEGDLSTDISNWDKYKNDEYDFQVEIDAKATVKTPWKTVYDTKVTHHCLTTSAQSSVNTSRIISDEKYKLEVSFKGFKSYDVKFGAWFHESYVNVNTAQFPQGSTVNSDTFFAASGSLHALPSAICVAYKPKIKLTVTTQLYKQQFGADANVNIDWFDLFSFRFKFDGSASLLPVDNGDGSTTVTFDSPLFSTPQVFGVVSAVRFDGNA